jgi:hypothetical protein
VQCDRSSEGLSEIIFKTASKHDRYIGMFGKKSEGEYLEVTKPANN